jgi:hypothetical protein
VRVRALVVQRQVVWKAACGRNETWLTCLLTRVTCYCSTKVNVIINTSFVLSISVIVVVIVISTVVIVRTQAFG